MGNSARDILDKYEKENKARAKAGKVYALKDSSGNYIRNRKTRRIIKKIDNPILLIIVKVFFVLLGMALLVLIGYSIYLYFSDLYGDPFVALL